MGDQAGLPAGVARDLRRLRILYPAYLIEVRRPDVWRAQRDGRGDPVEARSAEELWLALGEDCGRVRAS